MSKEKAPAGTSQKGDFMETETHNSKDQEILKRLERIERMLEAHVMGENSRAIFIARRDDEALEQFLNSMREDAKTVNLQKNQQ